MSFFSNIFGRGDTDTDTGGTSTNATSGDGSSSTTTTTSGDGSATNPSRQQTGVSQQDGGGGGEATTSVTDQSQASGGESNAATTKPAEPDGDTAGTTTDPNATQAPPSTATPTYLADWQGGISFNDAINNGQHSIAEYIADYNRYASANGSDPLDIFTMMNAMQNRDVNKSVQQNQMDEKKALRRERWAQTANLLAHVGNFVGTLLGAPSQTIESGVELTKRQQALREKTLALRNTYNQNLLAQIWKDRADQRAADKNKADIGLIQQRVQSLQADEQRKNDKNKADIALAGARQQQAEEAAALSQARAQTEKELRAPRVANMKASTNAHNASASASRARAAASNAQAYGTNYKSNRYKIWAQNRRKYPNDVKTFMEQNNIHSWDRKNWTSELIDQFNAWIADKHETGGSGDGSSSGGAADLLD